MRSKVAGARRSARRVEYDDDSDGVGHQSEEDLGEYAPGGPTVRQADGPRKTLKRRRRDRTPVELDEEEMDRRAEARRKKELQKQAKAKSEMFVHDSDDEDWDAERDAAFFAREQAIRDETLNAFKKTLSLGSVEPASSKKRKADEPAKGSKRRKTPPKRKVPFDDSDDDMDEDVEGGHSSRAVSVETGDVLDDGSGDEATDTPLSSQHAAAGHISEGDTPRKLSSATSSTKDVSMAAVEDDDDDEDEDAPVVQRRPAARNMRAGFLVDSDSE